MIQLSTEQLIFGLLSTWEPSTQFVSMSASKLQFSHQAVPAQERVQTFTEIFDLIQTYFEQKFEALEKASKENMHEVEKHYHEALALKGVILELNYRFELHFKTLPIENHSFLWGGVHKRVLSLFNKGPWLFRMLEGIDNILAFLNLLGDKGSIEKKSQWFTVMANKFTQFCDNLIEHHHHELQIGGIFYDEILRTVPKQYVIGASKGYTLKASFVQRSNSYTLLGGMDVGIHVHGERLKNVAQFQQAWQLNDSSLVNTFDLLYTHTHADKPFNYEPWLYVQLKDNLSPLEQQITIQLAIEMMLKERFFGLAIDARVQDAYRMGTFALYPCEDKLLPEKKEIKEVVLRKGAPTQIAFENTLRRYYLPRHELYQKIYVTEEDKVGEQTWDNRINKNPMLSQHFRWPNFFGVPNTLPTTLEILNRSITGYLPRFGIMLRKEALNTQFLDNLPQLGRTLSFESQRRQSVLEGAALLEEVWQLKRVSI